MKKIIFVTFMFISLIAQGQDSIKTKGKFFKNIGELKYS